VGDIKGSQLVFGGGVTGVTFGNNLLSQRAGFNLSHKLNTVQFEAANKALAKCRSVCFGLK
jgi:hypothetical protein